MVGLYKEVSIGCNPDLQEVTAAMPLRTPTKKCSISWILRCTILARWRGLPLLTFLRFGLFQFDGHNLLKSISPKICIAQIIADGNAPSGHRDVLSTLLWPDSV